MSAHVWPLGPSRDHSSALLTMASPKKGSSLVKQYTCCVVGERHKQMSVLSRDVQCTRPGASLLEKAAA
jgi:hypothetical protein